MGTGTHMSVCPPSRMALGPRAPHLPQPMTPSSWKFRKYSPWDRVAGSTGSGGKKGCGDTAWRVNVSGQGNREGGGGAHRLAGVWRRARAAFQAGLAHVLAIAGRGERGAAVELRNNDRRLNDIRAKRNVAHTGSPTGRAHQQNSHPARGHTTGEGDGGARTRECLRRLGDFAMPSQRRRVRNSGYGSES